MSDAIITVENLSKRYRLGTIGATSLRESVERAWHRLRGKNWREEMGEVGSHLPQRTQRAQRLENEEPRTKNEGPIDQAPPDQEQSTKNQERNTDSSELWALKDVSFEVKRGEVLGVIGRNGAGKSTLLKILTRITEPTSGRAIMRGRVASLLEVGTGFHPELTGRENVFLNGAILGMKRAEIARKFDEIVAFAEVEKFIDTPVKRYSSGMYVRLAFAVAAHLEPEILLVDEVLAVGDAAFQKRCLGKMGEVARAGRTVLFVSHNMAAVQNLCERCVCLQSGTLADVGFPEEIISKYLQNIMKNLSVRPLSEDTDRSGSGLVRLTSFHVEDENRRILNSIQSGQNIFLVFSYEVAKGAVLPMRNCDVGFSLHTSASDQTLAVFYASYKFQSLSVNQKMGQFRCRILRVPLAEGRYRIGARVVINQEESDWPREGVGALDVVSGDIYGTGSKGFGTSAPILLDGDWF